MVHAYGQIFYTVVIQRGMVVGASSLFFRNVSLRLFPALFRTAWRLLAQMLHCVEQCANVGLWDILLLHLLRVVLHRRNGVHGKAPVVYCEADDVEAACGGGGGGVGALGDVQRDGEVGSAVGCTGGDVKRIAWELNDAWSS